MIFINETETLGKIIEAGTQNLTGTIVATFFLILLFLLAIAFMFQIPLEYFSILILPFCLSIAAYYSNFMLPLIIILLYLSAIMAKHFLFK